MRRVIVRRTAVFLVSAVALAGAAVAIAWFFVTTRSGQLLDQRAFNGADFGQRSVAPVTLTLLDAIPITGVAVALIAAVLVTVFRRNWGVLIVAIAAAGLANITTQVLKNLILIRPDLGVPGYPYNSLPSGHTTLAASSALVVFLVVGPRIRPLVATVGALFTSAVGVSTLANQWHRPSDVVTALLVVAIFGCLAGAVLLRSRLTTLVPERDLWSRALLLLSLPCAGVAALALLVAAFAPFAYIGSAAAITTCVVLLTVAANRGFRVVL